MKQRVLQTALTVSLLIAAASCSHHNGNYGSFEPLPPKGWAYGDTLMFKASPLDSLPTAKSLRIAVRHNADYPFRNLVLEVTYLDGSRKKRDTVNMELADAHGSWKGAGLGPTRQFEAPVTAMALIADSAEISVRHVMRVDTLRGLSEIGIIIDNP